MQQHLRQSQALALATLVLVTLAAPAPVSAQVQPGIRAGVSADPDQFYVGVHLLTAPLVDRLRFRPNVEVGFGNDITLIAINPEFIYPFPLDRGSAWSLYVGGGPAINIYDIHDRTETEPGFNLLFGLSHREGFFTEFKAGMLDSPDLKFGVGYTW